MVAGERLPLRARAEAQVPVEPEALIPAGTAEFWAVEAERLPALLRPLVTEEVAQAAEEPRLQLPGLRGLAMAGTD